MKTLVVLSLFVAGTLAHAESLGDKEYWKKQQNYIDSALKSANKACDTQLAVEWVDRDKFKEESEKAKGSANGICKSIVDELGSLCRKGADEKSAVKAKITALKCGFAKPRTLDLKAGTLTYMGNNEESNFSDFARPWLLKNL